MQPGKNAVRHGSTGGRSLRVNPNPSHILIPGSRVIEHFPFPLGPGPGGFYFLKRRKTGRKAQDLTKLRDQVQARRKTFLLVVWLLYGILRLLTITKGKEMVTVRMNEKFEQAFDVLKNVYMFMHEDDEALYFKHIVTREYIKVQK